MYVASEVDDITINFIKLLIGKDVKYFNKLIDVQVITNLLRPEKKEETKSNVASGPNLQTSLS